MRDYCQWLLEQFGYGRKEQKFEEIIVQAIVSHIYLEWIHPFYDGNGRTGRLIEFYILLRGGFPNIASHILSNHYNETRSEYYRQIDIATKSKDLSHFIEYALQGLADGLLNTLELIQKNLKEIVWKSHIYSTIDDYKKLNKTISSRRKKILSGMNINNKYTFKDIFVLNRDVSELLKNLSDQTIKKDLEFLTEIQLINKDGLYYSANVDLLKGKYSKRKEPKKNKKGKIICWNQNMLRIKPRISSRSSSLKVIYGLAGILNTVSQISSEFPII